MKRVLNILEMFLFLIIGLGPLSYSLLSYSATITTHGPKTIAIPSVRTTSMQSWAMLVEQNQGGINFKPAFKQLLKRKEVVVAVIDTGIDYNHPDLHSSIFTPGEAARADHYGVDFSGKATVYTPLDIHGHGTHVSGIIKSVLPEVKILSLKYYNPQGTGQDNLNATIAALRFAVDSNVDIINYSGGGPEPSAPELKILKEAESKGILVVAAAGNEHANIDLLQNAYYPASYRLSNIISVTAHNQKNEILPTSNWGKNSVDISAPGDRILSSIPFGRYGHMTGTSQATAYVTGTAALIRSLYPDISATAIRNILVVSAHKVVPLSDKSISGGILDVASALQTTELSYSAQDQAQPKTPGQKNRMQAGVHSIRSIRKGSLPKTP